MNSMRQKPTGAAGRRVRMLLVDDNADFRALCATDLRRTGFEVEEAGDGEGGWTAVLAGNHPLVIAAYLLPKLSGLALAQRMRAAGMKQPVILMADSAQVDFRGEDPRQGINAVLVKPFTRYELMNRVELVLRPDSRNPFAPELREERQHPA